MLNLLPISWGAFSGGKLELQAGLCHVTKILNQIESTFPPSLIKSVTRIYLVLHGH